MAEMPEDWVATAHARGLLTFLEVAKLLDLRSTDVLDLIRDGELESERVGKKPCVSLTAFDDYRRRRLVA